MKTKGRNICDTLKAIRKQIADANGIDYSPEECHFKGECKGTCPRCEQDVRDLEHELRIRQMAGKAIKVAGVALGITALAASTTSCATQKGYYSSISEKTLPILFQEYTPNDSVLLKEKEALNKKGVLFVQGHLIDEQGDPQVGATITAKISGSKTIADKDGNFYYRGGERRYNHREISWHARQNHQNHKNEPRETQYYHFDRKQRCLGGSRSYQRNSSYHQERYSFRRSKARKVHE